MNITTLMGFAGLIGVLSFAIGKDVGLFFNPHALALAFGGAFSSTLINFPSHHVFNVLKVGLKIWFSKNPNPQDSIDTIVRLAEKARKEGFLALESEVNTMHDQFLKRGIQGVVDGMNRDAIKEDMEKQLSFEMERHAIGQELFIATGTYFPAFGMVGTLVGMVQMLYNLNDPKKVGPGMATAIVATFYGATAAYGIFIPIGGKLHLMAQEEQAAKEIQIEGVLALQAGEAPRLIKEKLQAYLAPHSGAKNLAVSPRVPQGKRN